MLIQQEDIAFINVYALNIGAPRCIKQILIDLRGEFHSNTIIVGDFNSPLTSADRSSIHKISKETLDLNDTICRWT